MKHSLLFRDNSPQHQKIFSDVFEQIHIREFFGDSVLSILSTSAETEDLLLRQAVFRALEDENNARNLEEFKNALFSLSQALDQYRFAKNECERLLTFYAYLSNFKRVGTVAREIKIDAPELEEFSSHLERLAPITAQIEEKTATISEDLKAIYESKLVFNPLLVHLQDDTPEAGLLSKLSTLAKNLEICEMDLPAQRLLSLPHELSGALIDLYPEQFAKIRKLEVELSPLLENDYLVYRDELNFFFTIKNFCLSAQERGLPICLPKILKTPGFCAQNAYDFTLLRVENVDIVPNDIEFSTTEPFYFLTGANGGGKTTYLRCVAANLILGSAGCPIFATEASVAAFPFIGVHFPSDETSSTGRLFEEQARADELMKRAKNGGFLFFNETFSGANDKTGLVLTLDCAQACKTDRIFGLFVTHMHEVGGCNFPILSTVVNTDQNNQRTYKITRETKPRSSYANDILKKYNLSHDTLQNRDKK